jgi:hypothetical protein
MPAIFVIHSQSFVFGRCGRSNLWAQKSACMYLTGDRTQNLLNESIYKILCPLVYSVFHYINHIKAKRLLILKMFLFQIFTVLDISKKCNTLNIHKVI